MSTPSPDIDELRREIDRIDDSIHDLLMRRVDVALAIGRVKATASAPFMRPAREAQVLRRLQARHRGPLPLPVLTRIWREIMSGGSLALQQAFNVAVYETKAVQEYRTLARDHFGSTVPLSSFRRPEQVIRVVAESRATAGIVPFPEEGESTPWWPLLTSETAPSPLIVARLPAVDSDASQEDGIVGLVVANQLFEPSGRDRSILAVETSDELSRAFFAARLERADLAVRHLSVLEDPDGDGRWHLIEVDEHIDAIDFRISSLAGDSAFRRIVCLGGYPLPLTDG